MNRVVTILNVALALVLAELIFLQAAHLGPRAIDDETAPVEVIAPDLDLLDREEGQRVRIDFGARMIPDAQIGEAAADGIACLEPQAALDAVWHSATELDLVVGKRLRPATDYTVHLAGGLATAAGRAIPGARALTFQTERLDLAGAVPVLEGPAERQQLRLRFNHAVAAADLERHLAITDSADRGVPFRIAPGDDEPTLLPNLGDDAVPTKAHSTYTVLLAENADAGPAFRPFVRVRLGADLMPLGGQLPLGREVRAKVVFGRELHVHGIQSHTRGLEINLNAAVPLPAKGTIRVEPEIPFQVESTWRGIRLLGDFPAGEAVAVHLAEGFPGRGTSRLPHSRRLSVRVCDLTPSIRLVQTGCVLSSRAIPELMLECVNVPRIRVTARTIYPNNVVALLERGRSYRRADHAFGPPRVVTLEPGGTPNQVVRHALDLAALLGPNPRGFHLIEVAHPTGYIFPVRRLLQVTDLGVTVRATGSEHAGAVAVQVHGLADGAPVGGAEVRVITPTNQALVTGVTDADGVAVLPYTTTAEDRVPHVISVARGHDRTLVDLRGFAVELARDRHAGRPYLERGLEAYVAFDRGVVRPGGEARATVVVRDAHGRAPAERRLELRWFGPDGRLRRTERPATDGSGLAVARLATTPGAATGVWRLDVFDPTDERVVGSAPVQVEAFVPDRLEAAVTVRGPARLGNHTIADISGRWLEGGPAAKCPVRLHVRFDHHRLRPEGYESFAFERVGRSAPPGARRDLSAALDADGEAQVRFDLPRVDCGAQALLATIVAEVQDPSGRPVEAVARATVLRPDFLLGVRAAADGAEVVALTTDGELFAGSVAVDVTLVRKAWVWRREFDRRGYLRWDSRVTTEVLERRTVQVETGRGRVAFKPATPASGWLAVVARAGGAEAEQEVGRRERTPDRLRVAAPEAPVAPGSEIELIVTAPFAGNAFVTLEGTSIHATATAALAPGDNVVRIPMPAKTVLPNLHAVVTLTAGQMAGESDAPVWIAGGTSVTVAHPARSTPVTVTAPAEVLPGSTVKIAVHAPGAYHAVVALVDEGVLRRTRHPSPDPAAWFAAVRRLVTRGADTGVALLDGVRFAADAEPGGDGGGALEAPRLDGSVSQAIHTVALFSGPLRLDAEGRAEVAFTLPAFEGRLRAAVIAAGPRVTGGASARVTVRAPLGLMIAMPRILTPGDTCRVPITVRNSSGAEGVVKLTLTAVGTAAGEATVNTHELKLARDERKTFEIPLTAGAVAGEQRLEVQAVLGSHRRVVSGRVTVQPVTRFDTEWRGFAVQGERKIAVPGRWLGGRARVVLTAGGSPSERLRPTLEALIGYPYGCVEQTTSKAFAVLACSRLLGQMHSRQQGVGRTRSSAPGNSATAAADAALHVHNGVDRLLGMQSGSGGLSMWSSGRRAYDFGSVYALDFLLAARDAGHEVPAAPLARLVDYVAGGLRDWTSVSLRAYAIEVLTQAGRPTAAWIESLVSRTTRVEDRARLALALARLGRTREAAALLTSGVPLKGVVRETGGELRSSLREQAIELRARLAAAPGDARVAEIAAALARRLARPRGLTTQEQGQALVALAHYHAVNAGKASVMRARACIDGTWHPITPGRALECSAKQGGEIRFETEGMLYGVLAVSGHRLDVQEERVRGLELKRTILDADSGEVATTFRRGGRYEVVLEGFLSRELPNLLVTDLVPGGFEIENPRLGVLTSARFRKRQPDHLEIRDDRVLFFSSGQTMKGAFAYAYRMRAIFPGTYAQRPFAAESLYEPEMRTQGGGAGKVVVE